MDIDTLSPFKLVDTYESKGLFVVAPNLVNVRTFISTYSKDHLQHYFKLDSESHFT